MNKTMGILLVTLFSTLFAQAQEGEYSSYRLNYNGMYCPAIQKDSVLYPANEIFANIVIVDEEGYESIVTVPAKGKTYRNVKKGAKRRNIIGLWNGPPQFLDMQVTVWEYDDGGPLVEGLTNIAVDFALSGGIKSLSKSAVRQGANRALAQGSARVLNEAIEYVDLTPKISRHISSLPKSLLGVSNDLIGSAGAANLHPVAYSKVYREAGFNYHFYTQHRRGGADCRLYFEFVPTGRFIEPELWAAVVINKTNLDFLGFVYNNYAPGEAEQTALRNCREDNPRASRDCEVIHVFTGCSAEYIQVKKHLGDIAEGRTLYDAELAAFLKCEAHGGWPEDCALYWKFCADGSGKSMPYDSIYPE